MADGKLPPTHRFKCGTYAGHQAHYVNGERPCSACVTAKRAYEATRRQATRTFIDKLKMARGHCVDCDRQITHDTTSEFHCDHIDPTSKRFEFAKPANRSLPTLRAEFEKCELRCKECHQKRTKEEGHHRNHRYGDDDQVEEDNQPWEQLEMWEDCDG